jgi:hypothetical protein
MVYKCENCNNDYKTKKSLRAHIKIKHSRIESLRCEKCDKYFVNQYKLRHHLYKTHPSKLHFCSFCGSYFKASIAIK